MPIGDSGLSEERLKKCPDSLVHGPIWEYDHYMIATTSTGGNMFTTNAHRTSQLSSTTLNKVVRTMIALAQAVGHADIAAFVADCALCGGTFPLSMIDAGHIVPASHGGFASPANLAPMCKECNNALGDEDATSLLRFDGRPLWDGELINDPTSCRVRDTRALWME